MELRNFITNKIRESLNNISSKYGFDYVKRLSEKGKVYYDVKYGGTYIGIIEFHEVENNFMEIDRIYLEKSQQKKGFGQKIIFDILTHTNSDGFILYPLDSNPWIKMGLSFIDGKYPYMIINKKEFMETNKNKL